MDCIRACVYKRWDDIEPIVLATLTSEYPTIIFSWTGEERVYWNDAKQRYVTQHNTIRGASVAIYIYT